MLILARWFMTGTCLVCATLAQAQPGGHEQELTWEFRQLAQHPPATLAAAAVFGAMLAAATRLLHLRHEMRLQRVRRAESIRAVLNRPRDLNGGL